MKDLDDIRNAIVSNNLDEVQKICQRLPAFYFLSTPLSITFTVGRVGFIPSDCFTHLDILWFAIAKGRVNIAKFLFQHMEQIQPGLGMASLMNHAEKNINILFILGAFGSITFFQWLAHCFNERAPESWIPFVVSQLFEPAEFVTHPYKKPTSQNFIDWALESVIETIGNAVFSEACRMSAFSAIPDEGEVFQEFLKIIHEHQVMIEDVEDVKKYLQGLRSFRTDEPEIFREGLRLKYGPYLFRKATELLDQAPCDIVKVSELLWQVVSISVGSRELLWQGEPTPANTVTVAERAYQKLRELCLDREPKNPQVAKFYALTLVERAKQTKGEKIFDTYKGELEILAKTHIYATYALALYSHTIYGESSYMIIQGRLEKVAKECGVILEDAQADRNLKAIAQEIMDEMTRSDSWTKEYGRVTSDAARLGQVGTFAIGGDEEEAAKPPVVAVDSSAAVTPPQRIKN